MVIIMRENAANTTSLGKLPLRVKVSYAMGGVGKNCLTVATAAYLLYLYVDVCGMDSIVASSIILVAKIWDIINDPMMGALVDRTVSKEGKCRFWLKYFSLPAGVIVALTFFIPNFAAPGMTIWVTVTYVLQGMVSTVLLIPLNTLLGRLTNNREERASLNQYSGVFGVFTNILITGYSLKLAGLMGNGDMRRGFMFMGIIYGVVYAVSFFIVYCGTRGYEPVETTPIEKIDVAKEKTPLPVVLHALLRNRAWLLCLGMYFIVMVAQALEMGSLPFYLQYTIGNSDIMAVYSYAYMGCGFLAYLSLRQFVKRLGNAGTAVTGCLLALCGYLLRFTLHDGSVLIMAAGWVFEGFGQGLIASTIVLNILDSKVYGLWKTGVDNDAILMSGFSVSYKTGMAIGGPIAGYLLKTVPYVAGAATQAESVQNLFFYECTLIPMVCSAICLLFCIRIRKTEKALPQMLKEIEERKLKSAQQAESQE